MSHRLLPETGLPERQGGFTLVEVLVALFMAALVFLMLGQMIGLGLEANRAATDATRTGALATEQLEELSQLDYAALNPGGSVTADTAGFWENLDVDADGTDDYTRRWEIVDLGSSKRIRVRVFSLLDVIGPAKEANYVTLIADK